MEHGNVALSLATRSIHIQEGAHGFLYGAVLLRKTMKGGRPHVFNSDELQPRRLPRCHRHTHVALFRRPQG
jgi:hypothetical protein